MTLDTERLEHSFRQVRERDVEFTTMFYSTLFADYPEVEPLFRHTHMHEQGAKLFKSLVLVVDNLRQPESLTNSLKGLGTRHINYGVLPQHYPIVGQSLPKTLEQFLGDGWTPPVQRAWATAYQAVSQIMLEGANCPPELLLLPSEVNPFIAHD